MLHYFKYIILFSSSREVFILEYGGAISETKSVWQGSGKDQNKKEEGGPNQILEMEYNH